MEQCLLALHWDPTHHEDLLHPIFSHTVFNQFSLPVVSFYIVRMAGRIPVRTSSCSDCTKFCLCEVVSYASVSYWISVDRCSGKHPILKSHYIHQFSWVQKTSKGQFFNDWIWIGCLSCAGLSFYLLTSSSRWKWWDLMQVSRGHWVPNKGSIDILLAICSLRSFEMSQGMCIDIHLHICTCM